jgi:hypothetical protein
MKRIALLVFGLLLTLMPAATAASTVKAGASCTKIGQSAVSADKKFTCVKVGKKLQWNKGVSSQSAKPTTGVDAHTKVVSQVLADWKNWISKKNTSNNPIKILVEPGYEANWSTAPAPASNLLIASFEGNSHTLLQEPITVLGDNKDWILKTGQTLSCSTVDVQQPLGIYCGHIQVGYGYFILNGKSTVSFASGTKLSTSQINTLKFMIAHDVATMYELQAQYGSLKYDGTKNQIPAWIREGFVQLFSALAVSESNNPKQSYIDFMTSSGLLDQFPRALCAKTLQDFESKDRNWGGFCTYSQNLYGVELLVARHGGLEALFNFVTLFGKSDDWPSSFKIAFGISREDFYAEWYDYLEIPNVDRPAIKAAAPSIHS